MLRNATAPAIPHIGLFLRDLVFIDDGHADRIDGLGQELDNMINFPKCVRLAERIKQIQLFQQAKFDGIKENPIVQKYLIEEFERLDQMSEETIWDMSSVVKKTDEKDAKRWV